VTLAKKRRKQQQKQQQQQTHCQEGKIEEKNKDQR
jgi:hypothetical protein